MSDTTDAQTELETLKARLAEAEGQLADLEDALTVAVEHGDIIEQQLVKANEQLQSEISNREDAQRRLQALVQAVSAQKDDLEIIIGTLIDHGDSVDDQMWKELLASETRGSTDALTGLGNRRAFDDHFIEQFGTCVRHGWPLTLLMCDVDDFKQYNDTYGHAQGDDCLKRVAQAIGAHASRAADLAVRYGGEEFAVVLPETDADGARKIATDIVEAVRALNIAHAKSRVADVVTISVGARTIRPERGDEPRTLLVQADHLLYRAKQLGRDQACFEDDVISEVGEGI